MPERVADLTVMDPHYRGRILVMHDDLSLVDARELADVYHALGYPGASIVLEVAPAAAEAA
jgi:hypothetical protein